MGKLRSTIIIFGLGLQALTACTGAENLDPLNQTVLESNVSQKVTVDFCTDTSYTQKQFLKTIIILDHSGSNKQNYRMNGSGGIALPLEITENYATDPTGLTRYGTTQTPGTLLNYLSTVEANDPMAPNRFFSLIDFSDSAKAYPANGFTSDTQDFYNYVLQDSGQPAGTPNDSGATNYLSALNKAYSIIQSDIQAAQNCAARARGSASPGAWCPTPGLKQASSYVIVFMSDGSPITSISGIGLVNGQPAVTGDINLELQRSDEILAQVGAISALTSNTKFVAGVNLFTIYYYKPGNEDENARKLLADMAKVGNGIAYNALSGSNINYDQFKPPARQVRFTLSDVFVTNNSAAWHEGLLLADQDHDGLADQAESEWGSNPTRLSTRGNGLSDLVYFNLSNGQRFGLDTTNYTSQCANVARQNGNYKSSDPNGLNDCEKLVLNNAGGIDNPDSNGDLIPDFLQLKNNIPFQIGTAPAVNQPDQDGYTLYQKVKFGLPTNFPINQLMSVRPAKYNLKLLSTGLTRDCYSLDVNDFPVVGATDEVRVDLIMKDQLAQDNYLYRVGKKSFVQGSASLNFKDWNDASEVTNQTWQVWP